VAIYHLCVQVISRSDGRSATAAAAYRSATCLTQGDQVYDYSKRRGVDLSEIHTPAHAPLWMSDRGALWSSVEVTEKRRDAQLAREIVIALPRELDRSGRIATARDYARKLVAGGMVVDLAVHHLDGGNPHAHLLCSTRIVAGAAWGGKARDWNSRAYLMQMRAMWRETCAVYGVAIDERSYAERGIPKLATVHVGVKSTQRARRGRRSEPEEINAAVEVTRPYPEQHWLDLLPDVAAAAPAALDRYRRLAALGHDVAARQQAWSDVARSVHQQETEQAPSVRRPVGP
jgi:hypothetical protein